MSKKERWGHKYEKKTPFPFLELVPLFMVWKYNVCETLGHSADFWGSFFLDALDKQKITSPNNPLLDVRTPGPFLVSDFNGRIRRACEKISFRASNVSIIQLLWYINYCNFAFYNSMNEYIEGRIQQILHVNTIEVYYKI